MKTTLLITLIALSVNVFAQNIDSSIKLKQRDGCTISDIRNAESNELHYLIPKNLHANTKQDNHSERSLIQKFDSIYSWTWDYFENGFVVDSQTVNMVYDNYNNLMSKLLLRWDDTYYGTRIQYTYTYDGYGNILTELWEKYESGIWENYRYWINTYDANNNLTNRIYKTWAFTEWWNGNQYI